MMFSTSEIKCKSANRFAVLITTNIFDEVIWLIIWSEKPFFASKGNIYKYNISFLARDIWEIQ